jgi:EmrB/QacA subfamily drug resistance transporter
MDARIRRANLYNALLCTFLVGVAYMEFIIALPTLAKDLKTDLVGMSWAVIAYQIATISLSLVFGRIGDLYSRHGVFMLGVLIFTAASLFCGFSQTVFQLSVFRFFQGMGGAMCQAQGRVLAMEAGEDFGAGKAQAYVTTAWFAGFLLGPTLGGWIIDHIHWRMTFFVLVPIGVFSLCASWRYRDVNRAGVAPVSARPPPTIDYGGIFFLLGATMSLIVLLDRRIMEVIAAERRYWLVIGLVGCSAAFLWRERTAESPILDLALFKIRMFSLSTVSLLFVSVGMTAIWFVLPFYLQEVLLLSPSFIGLLFISGPFLSMTVSPLGGHMADRLGARLPATAGAALLAAGSVLGAAFGAHSHWLWPAAMVAICGLGLAFFYPANHLAMIGSVPKEHRGMATGTIFMTFGLGSALGISLGSFLMTTAFRLYSGDFGATPSPEDPTSFVAAVNATFGGIFAASLVGLVSSALRGSVMGQHSNRA